LNLGLIKQIFSASLEDGAKETAEYFSVFLIRKQYCKNLSNSLSPISLSKHEGSASILQQAVQRLCPDILNGAGESKKTKKGMFVR